MKCRRKLRRVYPIPYLDDREGERDDIFAQYLKQNNFSEKKYQLDGIEWMINIEKNGIMINDMLIKSGLLCDEMGLGKTIQMLGLILKNFKFHNLIVVPRGLLEQWHKTIKDTLKHEPLIFHGIHKKDIDIEKIKNSPIVLTTYGMISGCFNEKNKIIGLLPLIKWNRIIFDEAHHLRNLNTRNHKSAEKLKAEHKWLVTGTPIQNSLTDFYGLCELLKLDKIYYSKIENIDYIREKLLLKRTKREVGIELPPLKNIKKIIKWETNDEKIFSQDIHSLLDFSQIKSQREDNIFKNSDIAIHHFAILHRARQSCIDMKLMENYLMKFQKLNLIDKKLNIEMLSKQKSKINGVIAQIKENKNNNNKKLIFCHFRMEINEIRDELKKMKLNVEIFDGRTNIEERKRIINDKNIDVLILQIQTGCEGLNLQHFNEIYFVSPHWNPAIEDQAIARCHRLNQEKEVIVYHFEMETFDIERKTKNLDNYVKNVQTNKRSVMEILNKSEPLYDSNNEELICLICLDEINNKDFIKLECNHYYHLSCQNKWENKSKKMGCCVCVK